MTTEHGTGDESTLSPLMAIMEMRWARGYIEQIDAALRSTYGISAKELVDRSRHSASDAGIEAGGPSREGSTRVDTGAPAAHSTPAPAQPCHFRKI